MKRSRDRFWHLLEPEHMRAMQFCRKLAADRDVGDDLYQDALMTAMRKLHQLRDDNAFRPWLYKVIVSTFKSRSRLRWRRKQVPLTAEMEERLVRSDPSEVHAARRWLQRAFQALSARERALITLYELEDWTIDELAGLYGKTESAIKVRLFRIRRKMRLALQPLADASESHDFKTGRPSGERKCDVKKHAGD